MGKGVGDMTFLFETPVWLLSSLCVIVLLVCIHSALSGVHSSYEQKPPLKKIVMTVVFVCLGMTICLFAVIALTLSMQEYTTRKFGFFVGTVSILLVPAALLVLVVFALRMFSKQKVSKWCRKHPGFCTVQLKPVRHAWDASKSQSVMPVSVDGVPIKQADAAIVTAQCLYIFSGNHTVEFSIFSATKTYGIGRSLPIADERKRIEKTICFHANRNYLCEISGGSQQKISISERGHVK